MTDELPFAPAKSWRDCLPVHDAATHFKPVPRSELLAMGADIKAHGLQNPVILLRETEDGPLQLLDGCQRLDAMEAVGMPVVDGNGYLRVTYETIDAFLIRRFDPYAYVRSVNDQRRHSTPAQRRQALERLLKAKPQLSDRAIARIAGVSDKTVGAAREKADVNAEIPHKTDRVEASGRRSRGRRPGTSRSRRSQIDTPPEPGPARTECRAPTMREPVAPEAGESLFDPTESYAAQLRDLMLKAMADRPFADWPRLAERLRDEIRDLEENFDRFRAEMTELGKCA